MNWGEKCLQVDGFALSLVIAAQDSYAHPQNIFQVMFGYQEGDLLSLSGGNSISSETNCSKGAIDWFVLKGP